MEGGNMMIRYKYILGFLAAIVCFTGLAGCEASSKGEEEKNEIALSRIEEELQKEAEIEEGLEETEKETVEISQETLADKVLSYTQLPTESLYFLMATEISYEGKMVRINEEDSGRLLDLFQDITVEKIDGWKTGERLYTLLLYGESQTQGCMVEVYDGWVRFNWLDCYKTSGNEFVSVLGELYDTSEELQKISPEEVLLSSSFAQQRGFTEEDIFYVNGKPALPMETGYGEMPPAQGEWYYETYICVEDIYFNEIGTAYQVMYYIDYHDDNGVYMEDGYSKIWNYYDYVTNEWGFILF